MQEISVIDILTAISGLLGALALYLGQLDRRRARIERERVLAETKKLLSDARANEKLSSADAADRLTGTALEIVEALKSELAAVRTELETLKRSDEEKGRKISELLAKVNGQEREIAVLSAGAEQLSRQVEELGKEPVFRPGHARQGR